MGHGVVGGGVAEILYTHKQKLFAAIGEEINVKHILDLREFPDSPYADRFTKDFNDIVNDIEVRVVVETMGGLHPAYEFVKECLSNGKSVVTSNKELVAAYGAELLAIASEQNANFMFEAAVGGGIPIIRPINQCLVANNVSEIAGILNGTTNFILTKMIHEGMGFDEALKLAQELGYAERNPEADVEGHDACRKICILASLAFGKHIYPDAVHTEGISKIKAADVEYAEAWGGVIKLIGSVKKLDKDTIDIIVAPMFVPNESQLANIESHKWQKGQSGNPKGKPKDRVKALLKQVLPKSKLKKSEGLTQDEINTIERSILALELSDLQVLAKADETPAYAKTLAMAAIIDMKNGKTTTVDRLMDRQYGKPQQKVDITTNGKQIQQGTPLTREEQIAYLKKLEEEY